MKPWLWIPASWAHFLSPFALRCINWFGEGQPFVWQSRQWRQLLFKNPLGIAGGVDKNGEFLKAWWNLGAGFVEIGTVTPEAQNANPGTILQRHKPAKALWNRMGFPSHGVEEVFFNLMSFTPPYPTPVFVNVGKNRHTPLEKAHEDCLLVMERLKNLADVFVLNVSSPNTPGLRELQKKEHLTRVLKPLVDFCQANHQKPLLIKLSPDMTKEELAETVMTADELGVSGFVLVNTTLARPQDLGHLPKEGGLSGLPLKTRAEEALIETIRVLGPRRKDKLIVSVGGVFDLADIQKRLALGADLVQVYSALIFEGPHFFRKIADEYIKTQKSGLADVVANQERQ